MIVGILGGGQLGRMLVLAGARLGIDFHVFDPDPDAPAGRLARQTCAPYEDGPALAAFARTVDVVTFETESIPPQAVQALVEQVPVAPSPVSLVATRDRLTEKQLLADLGIPTAETQAAASLPALANAIRAIGTPAIVKTRTLGYDGRGQMVAQTVGDARAIWSALGPAPLIVEAVVPFQRELSIIGVRARGQASRFYPLVENEHHEGILRASRAPARADDEVTATAESYASAIMESIDHIGVLTVELFDVGGALIANEIAPRVHNSGHWTLEGARTSQFENHVRAVCGLPLGPTEAIGHAAMLNLIGSVPALDECDPSLGSLHLYGKKPRPRRKVGHVTVVASSREEADRRLDALGGLPGARGDGAPSLQLVRSAG